jgi:hypothetical protein
MSLLDLNWMLHLYFQTESEVPTAVVEKSSIFWDRASSILFEVSRRFGGISSLKGDLTASSGIDSGLAHSDPESIVPPKRRFTLSGLHSVTPQII